MGFINVSEGSYLAMHGLAMVAQRSPERLTIKTLAEKLHASQAHLAKIFQKLSKANIVKSLRGPTGGFVLNTPAKEISFLTIYEIIEGPVSTEACPLGKTHCPFTHCIYGDDFKRISSEIYETYQRIKLSDFQ